MNNLADEIKKLKYDKRLIDGNLRRKTLNEEELQQYLSSLPDCAENVETFSLTEEASADDYRGPNY